MADVMLTADYDVFEVPAYSISKSALDMVVAKYHAEHNSRGLLFMGISPGVVDTGSTPDRKYASLIEMKILTPSSLGPRNR